jgi:HEAT repeat protein
VPVRLQAAFGVAQSGEKGAPVGVPILIDVLKADGTSPGQRALAAQALGELGPAATPAADALAHAVKSPHDAVSTAACLALARLGPAGKVAVEPLTECLMQDNDALRQAALAALRRVAPEAVLTALVDVLKAPAGKDGPSPQTRRHACVGLGEMGPKAKAAVPDLVATLKDPNWIVREQAAVALGKIGPGAVAALPALQKAISDSDPDVRREALAAVRRIGPKAALGILLNSLRAAGGHAPQRRRGPGPARRGGAPGRARADGPAQGP